MNDKKRPQSNLRAQKNSLSRRSFCVKKKATELAVLCDASLCLIQFDQDGQLNTFPEDASEVDNVLKRYLHVGDNVPEKRKVSGLSGFQGGGDVQEGSTTPPILGDELLDTKSAFELLNFRHVLDAKMKQLEEKIKLLKGIKGPEDKQRTCTFPLFYGDGTPFSPDDLQLSCKIPCSERDSTRPHLSLAHRRMGLAANNYVMTGDNFCSTAGCHATNCSSCDSGIKKMNNADKVENMSAKVGICQHHLDSSFGEEINRPLLEGDNIAVKKQKTPLVQLFYQDGTPCSSDDLQMSIKPAVQR